jgi:hypothetical protein
MTIKFQWPDTITLTYAVYVLDQVYNIRPVNPVDLYVTGYIISVKMYSENLEQYALEKTCANCLVKKGLNNFSGRGTAYVLLGYDIMHWLENYLISYRKDLPSNSLRFIII